MKKFLSVLLLLVLVCAVTVVAVNAATTDTYWSVSSECLVKVKQLDDGTVPTFKKLVIDEEYDEYETLLVGLPTNATYGGEYFQAKDGYSIKYYDVNGTQITASNTHIGTGDSIKVFDSSNSPVAQYTLVTYGDADGDGTFDVIDAHYASLFHNEKLEIYDNPAMFEAVKVITGSETAYVEAEDYQGVVNSTLKDNLNSINKGRKTPVDETINFASAVYAYDGSAKGAATIADANFKKLTTITYNGSTTVPSESGIYAVNATVADSEDYIVTPGTRNLGFVVIAPQASDGYKVTADNANKKITIGTTDNDASNATLAAAFEKWLNSAYTLDIGGTVNPTTVASALPNRSFEIYKGETQKTTVVKENSTAVLGSYLPDDETLWTNNTAANTKTVTLTNGTASFSFDLAFQQDEATIEAKKRAYFMDCADAARGQRTDYTSTKNSDGTLNVSSDVKKVNLFVKMKNGYPTVRMAVKSSSATCANAIAGTGMKGVLVGRNDSVAFQASQTTDFTGKEITSMFEDSGYRLSQYGTSDASKLMPVVNKVVAGMGISLPTNVFSLALKKVSDFVGKTGYCNYLCSGIGTNLRYNTVYFLEFVNYDGTGEDAHRTITTNTPANGTITVNPANTYLHERVYEHTIMNANEPVIVTATPASGYKLKSLTVTKADGTQVSVGADGYFLMPDSNITINAEFEAQ